MLFLAILNTLLLATILIVLLLAAGTMLQREEKSGIKLCAFLIAVLTLSIITTWLLYSAI